MSDFNISLISNKTQTTEIKIVRKIALDYLIYKEIIEEQETDCTLNSNKGYLPGNKASTVLNEQTDLVFKNLWTNGVEIIKEKTVFHTGGNGVDYLNCPICNSNIVNTNWGNYIDNWLNGKDDSFDCPNCLNKIHITNCNFEPVWGFSDFGITFWNWPDLKESFIKEMEEVLNLKLKKIYCHY